MVETEQGLKVKRLDRYGNPLVELRFYLPKELGDKAHKRAKEDRSNASEVMRKALEKYLD